MGTWSRYCSGRPTPIATKTVQERERGPVWLPFDLLVIFSPGVQEDSLRLFWDGGLGN